MAHGIGIGIVVLDILDMAVVLVCFLFPLLVCKCNKVVSLLRCATKKKVIVVAGPAGCCRGAASAWNLLLLTMWLSGSAQLCQAAPSTAAVAANETVWPPMQHYDIWSEDLLSPAVSEQQQQQQLQLLDGDLFVGEEELPVQEQLLLQQQAYSYNSKLVEISNGSDSNSRSRRPKVIHLFPVPVDGECLSDDGRRLGNCFNAYECRQKGGQAKGECAMGFGVCCVFVATCNGTISNNLTYIVSPEFPSFMPSNFTGCQLKVKMMSEDISQLRLDFYHFSLGQPNRRTGACDGDVFNISGGPMGSFLLCGQNSGQHLYYDVGVRALPRQSTLYGSLRPLAATNVSNVMEQLIEISLNVSARFLPIRLWEIRVAQIPFSQRAPAGCLQYHTGVQGVMQTFNFADNGRHLANQHYRICVRQETDMCSIVYEPCDEQSFRIGGGGGGGSFMSSASSSGGAGGSSATSTAGQAPAVGNVGATMSSLMQMLSNLNANGSTTNQEAGATTAQQQQASSNASTAAATVADAAAATPASSSSSSEASGSSTPAMTTAAPPLRSSTAAAVAAEESSTVASTASTAAADDSPSTTASPANDDVEGSGGAEDDGIFNFFGSAATTAAPRPGVSRRPRPVRGGFDLLGFLRSAFDLRVRHRRQQRQGRQFFSTCTDRITMPCIIEDFIGTGLGPLPGCEPVHCGSQFCSSGVWPCRIESTVTPFYLGVHFGDGSAGAGKGSAEDNIGACLRYSQVQCI